MKKTFTKIIVCFTLILVSFIFVGCCNVSYTNFTEDGIYNEVLEVTLNEQTLKDEGYNDLEITRFKGDMLSLANNTLNDKYSSYENKIQNNINKYKHDPEKKDLLDAYTELLTAVKITPPKWENNVFSAKIEFASKSAYLIFYDLTEKNFSKEEIEKGLFYNTRYYKGSLGYAVNYGLYSTLSHNLSHYFSKFTPEDTSLSYTYLAPSSRYHSNADQITYYDDGYYAHTWKVDTNNLDKEIYFYLRLANRWIWYLTAILISLVVVVILIVIAIIKHLITKKKEQEKIL